jgi:electron transfer flavoprotein-quinone oxidoreductase
LRGGKLLEYGSHLVPEGGMGMMPKLFTGGMLVVGDAAGLSLNNGFVVRGMDMAIASGMIASDVIIESKTKNDFSAQCLSRYKNLLEESFVMADMRTFSRAPAFMKNEDLYEGLPKIITGIMHDIYDQQTLPKEHLISVLMENIKKSKMSVIDLAGFGWNGVRSL